VIAMTDVHTIDIDRDGERRAFVEHGHAMLANAGGLSLLKGVFEPGWRWSADVAPLAGTQSCQTHHLGYTLSGRMHVTLDDGTEFEIGPGQLFDLPAGHDAWVIGDEPCVMIDVSPEATRYARPAGLAGPEDKTMAVVRRGYAAFNAGDTQTLRELFTRDVVQHVPGSGPLAGTYKGVDSVLGYYARLGEMTAGTFRANLIEVHSDGQGHVTAVHQTSATRNGATRISRGSIVFTFLGDRASDLLELHADLPGDDAFLA
jgi:ketosteroid isomerase-like protein